MEVHRATGNISTDEIGVHFFEGRGGEDAASQYGGPEPGGEALDLCFESLQHVECRAVRDVAVRPGSVASRWGARAIEQTRLS